MPNYMSILQLVKSKYLYQKIHRSKKKSNDFANQKPDGIASPKGLITSHKHEMNKDALPRRLHPGWNLISTYVS